MSDLQQSDKEGERASRAQPGDEIRPSRYRKKPVVIEAIRWCGTNLKEVIDFTGLHPLANKWSWEEYEAVVAKDGFKIFTLEGAHMVTVGDYVIRGVKGEFYACKPDIFWMTYEREKEATPPWFDGICSWCGEYLHICPADKSARPSGPTPDNAGTGDRWQDQRDLSGGETDAVLKTPRCRSDGRCQYAIDHGAEGLGHCPVGKCVMPPDRMEVYQQRYDAERKKGATHDQAHDLALEDVQSAVPQVNTPIGLHPTTKGLVIRFAHALAKKLHKAEEKYGYDDGWCGSAWEQECRERLYEHLAKGDPRDVANYCAFMWHHGWSTSAPSSIATPASDMLSARVAWLRHLGKNTSDPYPGDAALDAFEAGWNARQVSARLPMTDAKDAARYRFLRTRIGHYDAETLSPAKCYYRRWYHDTTYKPDAPTQSEMFDAAIDAAMDGTTKP